MKCQYTKKHECHGFFYKITRHGKPRIYCDRAINLTNDIIYVIGVLDDNERELEDSTGKRMGQAIKERSLD